MWNVSRKNISSFQGDSKLYLIATQSVTLMVEGGKNVLSYSVLLDLDTLIE